MLIRVVSALVGIALWLGICFGGLLPFTMGITFLTGVAIWEIVSEYRNCSKAAKVAVASELPEWSGGGGLANQALAWIGVALPLCAWWICTRRPEIATGVGNAIAVLAAILTLAVPRFNRTGETLGGALRAYGLLGPFYVGALFAGLVLLRGIPGRTAVAPFHSADLGAWLVILVSACAWITDTFAFAVGKSMGKQPLAPRLSPHKTVEGSIGGLLGAALVGAAVGAWIHLPPVHGLAVGLIAGSAGQVGDLFESALKREIGVKDFGKAMPGHGGVLDRFDSLLFVAPIAYLYLRVVAGV